MWCMEEFFFKTYLQFHDYPLATEVQIRMRFQICIDKVSIPPFLVPPVCILCFDVLT